MEASSPTKWLIVTITLLVLVFGTWAFVIVTEVAHDEVGRRYPSLADIDLPETLIVASIFLAGSFLGVGSSVRLARSRTRLHRVFGLLSALLFAVWFVVSLATYLHHG